MIRSHIECHAEQVTGGVRGAFRLGIEAFDTQVGFLQHIVDEVVRTQAATQPATEVFVVGEEQPEHRRVQVSSPTRAGRRTDTRPEPTALAELSQG